MKTLLPTITTTHSKDNYNDLRPYRSLSSLIYDALGFKESSYKDGGVFDLSFPADLTDLTDTSVNWKENTDCFTLKLDVPGFKLAEIDVDFNDGKLAVTAESKRSGYENKFYKEIYVSNFERVDVGKVSAKLEDGVLQIILPKSEKTKGRKIVVQ